MADSAQQPEEPDASAESAAPEPGTPDLAAPDQAVPAKPTRPPKSDWQKIPPARVGLWAIVGLAVVYFVVTGLINLFGG